MSAAASSEQAWTGLLRAYRRLTRELEGSLRQRHGLTLSALELLGHLAAPHSGACKSHGWRSRRG